MTVSFIFNATIFALISNNAAKCTYQNGCLQKNMIIACTTTVSYSYLLSGKILHITILSNKILYKEQFLWLQLYNKQTNT